MAKPTPDGIVTCPWNKKGNAWRSGRHGGIDYRAPIGTPITAIADGTLVYGGRGGGWGASYGIHVIIQHAEHRVIYAHLSSFDSGLIQRREIKEGQQIGLSGATGNCHGPHLHLESRVAPYRYDIDAVDPGPLVDGDGPAPKVEAPKVEATKLVESTDKTHKVTRGQTLSGIAKKYGTTVAALAAKNNIADPSKIKVGQIIKI